MSNTHWSGLGKFNNVVKGGLKHFFDFWWPVRKIYELYWENIYPFGIVNGGTNQYCLTFYFFSSPAPKTLWPFVVTQVYTYSHQLFTFQSCPQKPQGHLKCSFVWIIDLWTALEKKIHYFFLILQSIRQALLMWDIKLSFVIPPRNEVEGGYTGFTMSVRL